MKYKSKQYSLSYIIKVFSDAGHNTSFYVNGYRL